MGVECQFCGKWIRLKSLHEPEVCQAIQDGKIGVMMAEEIVFTGDVEEMLEIKGAFREA